MFPNSIRDISDPFVRRSRLSIDGVLIESYQILVLQNLHIGLAEFRDIRSNEQWRLHHSPESEMGSAFFSRQVTVTHMEHVGIIVTAKVSKVAQEGVHVEDASNTAPVCWKVRQSSAKHGVREGSHTSDIVRHSPRLPSRIAPGPRLVGAPVAETVQNCAVLSKECMLHDTVSQCGVRLAVITPIHRPLRIADGHHTYSATLHCCIRASAILEVAGKGWVGIARVARLVIP